MPFKMPEGFRLFGVPDTPMGTFCVPVKRDKRTGKPTDFANVIASIQCSWEHVSVTIPQCNKPQRCPTWDEMCAVKDWFWDESDVVVQFHPAKKDYINLHPFCLHLWRCADPGNPIPIPATWMVL